MARKYCLNCRRYVNAKADINWAVFLLLLLFGFGIIGVIYLIWKCLRPVCPICKDRNFGEKK